MEVYLFQKKLSLRFSYLCQFVFLRLGHTNLVPRVLRLARRPTAGDNPQEPLKTNIFKKIVDVIDINLKDVKKSTSSRLLPEL